MKHKITLVGAVLSAALLLSSCAAMFESVNLYSQADRNAYIAKHTATLSTVDKTALMAGDVRMGESKAAVLATYKSACSSCYGTVYTAYGSTLVLRSIMPGLYGERPSTIIYFDASGHVKGWSH